MLRDHTQHKLHYIAMYGDRGCLPDGCHSFDDRTSAIKWLVATLDLPPHGNIATKLHDFGYAEMMKYEYGAEYAEIKKCDCDTPEVRNDD